MLQIKCISICKICKECLAYCKCYTDICYNKYKINSLTSICCLPSVDQVQGKGNSRLRTLLCCVPMRSILRIHQCLPWLLCIFLWESTGQFWGKSHNCREADTVGAISESLFLSAFYLCFWKFIFVYFWERERESARTRAHTSGGGAEREGDRIPSRLRTVSAEPYVGLELMNHEIMTWAETKSQSDA